MTVPISYLECLTKDNVKINGYISFPVNIAQKSIPLIVKLHGGPWSRDHWGYNNEIQWLTSIGIACLTVNYRGSTGFGKMFVDLGNKQYGNKVIKDIICMLDYVFLQYPFIDRKLIGIMGHSFGGYISLMCIIRNPEIFNFCIAINCPVDLLDSLKGAYTSGNIERDRIFKRIGNPMKDIDFLKSNSPFYNIDKIITPFLLINSKFDEKVDRKQILQFVDKCERAKKAVTHIEINEKHVFVDRNNMQVMYSCIEKYIRDRMVKNGKIF